MVCKRNFVQEILTIDTHTLQVHHSFILIVYSFNGEYIFSKLSASRYVWPLQTSIPGQPVKLSLAVPSPETCVRSAVGCPTVATITTEPQTTTATSPSNSPFIPISPGVKVKISDTTIRFSFLSPKSTDITILFLSRPNSKILQIAICIVQFLLRAVLAMTRDDDIICVYYTNMLFPESCQSHIANPFLLLSFNASSHAAPHPLIN